MKRAAVLSLALLFGSIACLAQSANQYHPQKLDQDRAWTLILEPHGLAHGCPISLRAQQSAAAWSREVSGNRFKGVAQLLHLVVTNPDSRQIAAANITVRGFADKGRVVQTMSNQDSSNAAKTFDVAFPNGPGEETSADLAVPGLSAVTVIDLNSVTYSDGSIWKLAAGSACRSWIDGMMLVGSR